MRSGERAERRSALRRRCRRRHVGYALFGEACMPRRHAVSAAVAGRPCNIFFAAPGQARLRADSWARSTIGRWRLAASAGVAAVAAGAAGAGAGAGGFCAMAAPVMQSEATTRTIVFMVISVLGWSGILKFEEVALFHLTRAAACVPFGEARLVDDLRQILQPASSASISSTGRPRWRANPEPGHCRERLSIDPR